MGIARSEQVRGSTYTLCHRIGTFAECHRELIPLEMKGVKQFLMKTNTFVHFTLN